MKALEFIAYGEPKGQPRARSTIRRGKGGKVFSGVYDPGTADDWKSIVRAAALEKWDQIQFKGPTSVSIRAFFQRPKSHFNSKGQLKPNAPRRHVKKPDRDNLDKAILDALVSCGVLADDCIVCAGGIAKWYTDSVPYAEIVLCELED